MKKFLSTAMVLGILYGTVNAAPITSPIYMPEAGKILSNLSLGYTTSKFNKGETETNPNKTNKLEESYNISAKGKFGLLDNLALNYAFDFDFSREIFDADASEKFTNMYFGVTNRILNYKINKLDLILNIGQQESLFPNADQVFVDLAIRYGLELDIYNLGFSVNAQYINDFEYEGYKLETGYEIGFNLDNEFIITDNITVGLDLFIKMKDKVKITESLITKKIANSYNSYGFNLDVNYGFDGNNLIGVYFGMDMSDLKIESVINPPKDPSEYKFGLKLVSQF